MLLFNNDTVDEDSLELIFQNILCYCLTISDDTVVLMIDKFQNILCYCLTESGATSISQTIKFQNILCYCLTVAVLSILSEAPFISKHPMLLFNPTYLSRFHNLNLYIRPYYTILFKITSQPIIFSSASLYKL